jgi:hypothetical protein
MITGTLTWPIKEPGTTRSIYPACRLLRPSPRRRAALSLTSTSLVVWLTGGVSGRYYWIKIDVTTLDTLSVTRTYEWLIGMTVDPELAPAAPTMPPSAGFGTPVTWAAA